MLRFGLVGAGVIGCRRASTLTDNGFLVAVSDISEKKLSNFSESHIEVFVDWRLMLDQVALDAIIIATTHDVLAEITAEALKRKIHVFVEKPAARCLTELKPVLNMAVDSDVIVRVGFNHRFHPAMIKAKELLDDHVIGPLMFIRGRYGHGGRVGYDKEWRFDPHLSGGGELIDQGPHLIDLSRWFLGEEFVEVQGDVSTFYWDIKVDDNAFLHLSTETGKIAFLHVSCTEWKNLFSMEIYGKTGKIEINGLGGSYGVEKITLYKMLPEMGPPETFSWEYPMPDTSWKREINSFVDDIINKRQSSPNLHDAYRALAVIDDIYGDRYDYS
ncbi:Gfo/Idh/MocA family oxidoreductase [Planktomarina temperata]|nr:Gfo/Idh/MocA family oxidoreductase [Planktomarina temperata]MDC1094162.1 Gfo/Idh/MocA family oxidoreductase [Planktomarina temperata]